MREQNHRQRKTRSTDFLDVDPRQLENEYLIQQHSLISTSAALNEMLSFKKELEKSERKCQDLAEQLEVNLKKSSKQTKISCRKFIDLVDQTTFE